MQSLCSIEHHPINIYGENAGILTHISKPEIKGGELTLSSLDVSLPGQRTLGNYWIQGWENFRAAPHAVAKKNNRASPEGCTVAVITDSSSGT